MKFYYLLHSMLAQKGANTIKIVSVAVGLLVSCVLFTKLEYNYSYDTCFRDYDRLYQIRMAYEVGGEKIGPFESCVGKLSGGIYDEMQEYVSSATNISKHIFGYNLYDGDTRLDIISIASDSLFFETMGIEVLAGQPKYDLAMPATVYISESLARTLYGSEDAVGRMLSLEKEMPMTVRGVFRDLPENITLPHFDAVVSMQTAPSVIARRFQWAGADSWPTYLRLRDGVDIDAGELSRILTGMYHSHVPDTETNKTWILAAPIHDTYLGYETVKKMNLVMWVLGISLLLMTTFNYVLITIASLSRRAKGIGVHKCSGAGAMTVMGMFLGETAVILFFSVLLMALMLVVFEPMIQDIVALSVSDILSPRYVWVSVSILAFFFIVGGLLPGRLFSKIPVTQVFRRFTDRNSAWKRALLFVQIGGVSFVAGLLATVAIQYADVMNYDLGYNYKNKVSFNMIGYERKDKEDIFLGGVKALPYVNDVSWSISNLFGGYSGDYVFDASGKTLFNSRIEWADASFVKFMEMPLVQGNYDFKNKDVIVNETFARRMGWGDDAVGNHVERINDIKLNVAAVVKDFVIGDLTREIQPVVICVEDWFSNNGYAELKEPFDENYKKLEAYFQETYPNADLGLRSLKKMQEEQYESVLMFRNAAIITAVALVFIALMGLIGFTRDEVERRRKEIAVRKVNGASTTGIIVLICRDLMKIAVPAVVVGIGAAWYVGPDMVEHYTIKASHLSILFILSGLAILVGVVVCVIVMSYRAANENPVTQLKSE